MLTFSSLSSQPRSTFNIAPPDGPFAPLPGYLPFANTSIEGEMILQQMTTLAQESSHASFALTWSMTGRNWLIPCVPQLPKAAIKFAD